MCTSCYQLDVRYYVNYKVKNSVLKRHYSALRDLVAFVQFKKREKHPWWSVNFSKVADFKHLNSVI